MNKRLLSARATQQDVIAQRRPTNRTLSKWTAGLVGLALAGQAVAQGIPFTEGLHHQHVRGRGEYHRRLEWRCSRSASASEFSRVNRHSI